MCIIAAKPAGIGMPDDTKLKNMWDNNPDGAGFMYAENGAVRIQKGFMTYKAFTDALNELKKTHDLTALSLVLHFRITTHGGTSPENTHPFPISDSIGKLQKLTQSCTVGVAHNGIIHNNPRKGISDTMEYIATQLYPLSKAMPKFYANKYALQLIEAAIDSKMVLMNNAGEVFTVGAFKDDEGVLYSNTSYSYSYYRDWRSTCFAPAESETIEKG